MGRNIEKRIIVALEIREYFYGYCNQDYDRATKAIASCGIKSIQVKRKLSVLLSYKITIGLNRPGLLIGYKGRHALNLEEIFKKKLGKPIKVEYVEDDLDGYLLF